MLVIEQRRPEQVEVSALLVALEPASDAVKDPVPVGVADPSLAEVTVGRIPQRRSVHVVLSDSETVMLGADVSDGTEPLLPVSVVCVSDGLERTVVGVGLLGATEKSEVVDGLQTVSPNKLTDRTPSHCWLALPILVGAEPVLEDAAGLDPGAIVDASELVPLIPLDKTLDPEGEVTGALDSEGTLVVVAVADDELPLDSEVVTGPQKALTPIPNNCNPAAQDVVGAASDEDCVVPPDVETKLVEGLPSDEGDTKLVEGDVNCDVDVLADDVKSDDDVESEVNDEAVDDVASVADDKLPLGSEVVTGPQKALTPRPNNCNPAAQDVVGAASDEDCVVPPDVETELVEELPSDEGGTKLVEGDVNCDVDVLADDVKSDDDVESEVDDEAVDEVTSVADDVSVTEVLEPVADGVGSEDDDESVAEELGLVADALELFGAKVIPRI
ncbi:hypothetical protein ACEPAI_9184 [Sanghuangporus weigelae]